MPKTPLIPVTEKDFLTNDPPIRGQAFACISTICPENILASKDAFYLSEYISKISADLVVMFDVLKQKYPDDKDWIQNVIDLNPQLFDEPSMQEDFKTFRNLNYANIEDEFHKANDFQTSIRGLKIRGSYSSLDEARARAVKLHKDDPKHNVWVAEIGAWIPLADNPDVIKAQEYSETQLNTLMKKYHENNEQKDAFFQERKRVMNDDKEPAVPVFKGEIVDTRVDIGGNSNLADFMEGTDPWSQNKVNDSPTNILM